MGLMTSMSSLTDRYQTTVPEPVRRALDLHKRDKIRFVEEENGQNLPGAGRRRRRESRPRALPGADRSRHLRAAGRHPPVDRQASGRDQRPHLATTTSISTPPSYPTRTDVGAEAAASGRIEARRRLRPAGGPRHQLLEALRPPSLPGTADGTRAAGRAGSREASGDVPVASRCAAVAGDPEDHSRAADGPDEQRLPSRQHAGGSAETLAEGQVPPAVSVVLPLQRGGPGYRLRMGER